MTEGKVHCWKCGRVILEIEESGSGKVRKVCERCKASNVVDLRREMV